MYKNFLVRNYKCFKELEFRRLGRINIIAGKNNVGKTAALEAVFIFSGPHNPLLAVSVNNIRGVRQFRNEAADLWGWSFRNKEFDNAILMSGENDEGDERILNISLQRNRQTELFRESEEGQIGASGDVALSSTEFPNELQLYCLSYYANHESKGRVSYTLSAKTKDVRPDEDDMAPLPSVVLVSTNSKFSDDSIDGFSELEAKGRLEEVLSVLRIIEPNLKKISLLQGGGESMLHGDVGLGELIPLPMLGEGLSRVLSLTLAILRVPGGAVLIDEVENGIHHSAMTSVWKALYAAAEQNDVQIFATTHSRECIAAGHEAMKDSGEGALMVHRIERDGDETRVISYDKLDVDDALALSFEFR